MSLWSSLFNRGGPAPQRRDRLSLAERPETVYAIGDVHGCLDALVKLERRIVADARDRPGRKHIVMVGDYVDRGPQAAQVLDHVSGAPPAGFERTCLLGNHEQLMLAFLSDPAGTVAWLEMGGHETLNSYAIPLGSMRAGDLRGRAFRQLLDSHIPRGHIDFMRNLPTMIEMPGFVFVHAGVRPGVALAEQDDEDLVWIREEFLGAADTGLDRIVVHGHTPATEPARTPTRIGIDTGAFATGRLTAVRIDSEGGTEFLTSD